MTTTSLVSCHACRLHHRRVHSPVSNDCVLKPTSVLMHCEAGMEADTAAVVAGWLHWHAGLGIAESISAAEQALGAAVPKVWGVWGGGGGCAGTVVFQISGKEGRV